MFVTLLHHVPIGVLESQVLAIIGKEAYWQLERKKFRRSKNGPTPISIAPAAPMLPRLAQSLAQAHSVSSSFGRPRPSITTARTRFQPHLVSQQLVRTCNSSIRTNRGSALASMRPVFKRCGYLNRDPSKLLRQAVSCRAKLNINASHTDAISTIGLSSQLPAFSQPTRTPTSLPGFQGCGIPSAVTSDSRYVSPSVNCTQNLSMPTYASNCHIQSNQQPSAVLSDVTSLTSHGILQMCQIILQEVSNNLQTRHIIFRVLVSLVSKLRFRAHPLMNRIFHSLVTRVLVP